MPNTRPMVLFVAVLILYASASVAAPAPQGQVAQITVSPNMIQWQVLVPSESLSLRVGAPDGETYTFESKGQAVNLTLKELGDSAIDGTFTYDLLVTPPITASVKAKLKEARQRNDDAAARKIAHQAGLDRPTVESGAFSVANGGFVWSGLPESGSSASGSSSATSPESSSATSSSTAVENGVASVKRAAAGRPPLVPIANDQVIADDLIVQGSTCVGLDCVVNESFGFDTIRLKENNTRIKFEDTSTSTGFPTTDWQLTANDSASGGASKFSIEDVTDAKVPFTVLANAPTNSLFVASTGKLGLRTSSPVLDIHAVTSDTPAIRLEQTSAGGFTAQTWDIAGNEANFFVRDVTGGSRLPFRIRPGAPTSSIDITASGNVAIGGTTASDKLQVYGGATSKGTSVTFGGLTATADTTAYVSLLTLGSGRGDVYFGQAAANWSALFSAGNDGGGLLVGTYLNKPLIIGTNNTERLRIDSAGNIGIGGVAAPANPIQHSNGAILTAGGVWQNASSRELKQDICDLDVEAARDTLAKLDPVTFAYKVDPAEHHAGFIAEDVPDLVAAKDRKSLSAMDIVAVLTKVVQDQQKTIDDLTSRIREMEARVK